MNIKVIAQTIPFVAIFAMVLFASSQTVRVSPSTDPPQVGVELTGSVSGLPSGATNVRYFWDYVIGNDCGSSAKTFGRIVSSQTYTPSDSYVGRCLSFQVLYEESSETKERRYIFSNPTVRDSDSQQPQNPDPGDNGNSGGGSSSGGGSGGSSSGDSSSGGGSSSGGSSSGGGSRRSGSGKSQPFIDNPETDTPVVSDNTPAPTVETTLYEDFVVLNKDINIGESHDVVLQAQKLLNRAGFTVSRYGAGSPGEETRYLGSKTQNALLRFQRTNNIEETGILDVNTQEKLAKTYLLLNAIDALNVQIANRLSI